MQLDLYKYWIDVNLPPKLANWLSTAFNVTARHASELHFLLSSDNFIFEEAKKQNDVVLLTKDEDFVDLVLRKGYPPYIIWITCGNISNQQLNKLIIDNFEQAVSKLLTSEQGIIELR